MVRRRSVLQAIAVVWHGRPTRHAEPWRPAGRRISGEQAGDLGGAMRVAFQPGRPDAMVFTVTGSFPLPRHAVPGVEPARALIVHDRRHRATQLPRIEGRSRRGG